MKKVMPKYLYVIIAVIMLAVIGSFVLSNTSNQENTSNSEEYTTLTEDVNNSCSEDGLSTAAAQKLVEIQVPTNEVDEYLQNAVEENRCVYRAIDSNE